MRIRITIRRGDEEIISKSVRLVHLPALAGKTGQAIWEMLGQLQAQGESALGMTIDIAEEDEAPTS